MNLPFFSKKFTAEAEYLGSISMPWVMGGQEGWSAKILQLFPAFASQNYRLYFSGQLVSLSGTWLQMVAQGWLVLQLTNSPFLIGLVAALGTLPSLVLSLFGGVITDHFPKKYILLWAQIAAMLLAFIQGGLTMSGVIDIYYLIVLSLLLGIVGALEAPARQAYVSELVDRKGMASAIALNSGMFNAARVIGPSIAGILIAWVGTGGAFMINGLSYLAVIWALFKITTPTMTKNRHLNPIQAITDGLRYSWNHQVIRLTLLYLALMSLFGWSYITLMPLIAKDVFHVDAAGLGYLFAAGGVGSVLATFFVSAYAHKVSRFHLVFLGNTMFAVSIIGFTLTTNLGIALVGLFFAGLGLLMMTTVMTALIQSLVDDQYRGRVMSIYSLVFMGLMPLGNLQVGYVSEFIGPAHAIQLGAVIVFMAGLYAFWQRTSLRKLHTHHFLLLK